MLGLYEHRPLQPNALACESVFRSAKGARAATEAALARRSLCLFLMGEHDVSDEIRQRENDRANAQTLQQKIDWLRTVNQQSQEIHAHNHDDNADKLLFQIIEDYESSTTKAYRFRRR